MNQKSEISTELLNKLIVAQRNEITEYIIYKKLARKIKNQDNSRILNDIAENEMEHFNFWKKYSNKQVKPKKTKVLLFYSIARIFGLTFGIKLMEKGEEKAQKVYAELAEIIPEAKKIIDDEERHEHELIEMLNEQKLNYVGSIVLGLNDALVELTGALAGLSFALQNTRIVAIAGLITGIAASFSMAASEYLSTKAEGNSETAFTSSLYTGIAYIITVMLLILPYLVFASYIVCLIFTISTAIFIIFFFNYYIAVAKDLNFKKRFSEMLIISLGVAAISFFIGFVVRKTLGIEI